MLVFENHSWQTHSDFPDTNYLKGTNEKQPKWVVHDNSEVAAKVRSNPFWEAVEDETGQLIDVIPINPPVTDEDKILSLKNQLTALDGQAIRPLRAIAAETDTDEDREILADLERQAKEIRSQITELEENTGEGVN